MALRDPLKLNYKARIPELDGIRGIAIAMVLLHHYFFSAIQAQPGTLFSYVLAVGRLTWSGVDLFFVLSGFLIGGILLDVRDSLNYYQVFYTRRALRILPLYATCLFGTLALDALIRFGIAHQVAWMADTRLPWTPYFLFLQNFWMAQKTSYGFFGLGVTWSLAVEEQFYLTLPLIVRRCKDKTLFTTLVLGICAAPAMRLICHSIWPSHPYVGVVLMFCRSDALLLGVLGAMILRNPQSRQALARRLRGVQIVLIVLAGGAALLTIKGSDPYGTVMLTVGFSWLAAFYLCLLVYTVLSPDNWIGQCLRTSWLCWLGSIAYGVYLVHESIRALIFGILWSIPPQVGSLPQLEATLLALTLTLIVCSWSWRYLEKPLTSRGHKLSYLFGQEELTQQLPLIVPEGTGI